MKYDIRIQVPVDVAVKEPWTRIVGEKPNRYVVMILKVGAIASAHDIANDGVVKVVGRISGATDHVERVLVRKRKHISEPAGGYGTYNRLPRAGEKGADVVRR